MKYVAILSAIYWAACQLSGPDENTAKLERRVVELEEQLKEKAAKEGARRDELSLCFLDADQSYWNYVQLNGHKKRGTVDTWIAPTHIWDTAAKNKANAIEECKARWR